MSAVVLDNEALQAVADLRSPKHTRTLAYLKAAALDARRRKQHTRVFTPTVVRLEAGLSRHSPGNVGLGLFRVRDVPLDSDRVEQALALPSAQRVSPADAAVAELASSLPGDVVVLTSDGADLEMLLRDSDVLVIRV